MTEEEDRPRALEGIGGEALETLLENLDQPAAIALPALRGLVRLPLARGEWERLADRVEARLEALPQDPEERAGWLGAAAWVPLRRVRDRVRALLEQPDRSLSVQAALALAEARDGRAARVLLDALGPPAPAEVARALAMLDLPEHAATLARHHLTRHHAVREEPWTCFWLALARARAGDLGALREELARLDDGRSELGNGDPAWIATQALEAAPFPADVVALFREAAADERLGGWARHMADEVARGAAAAAREATAAPAASPVERAFEAAIAARDEIRGNAALEHVERTGPAFRPDVDRLLALFARAEGMRGVREQIAWTAARASAHEILASLGPALRDTDSAHRAAAAELFEGTTRLRGAGAPFLGAGGTRGPGAPPPPLLEDAEEQVEEAAPGGEPPADAPPAGGGGESSAVAEPVHLAASAPREVRPGDAFVAQLAAYVSSVEGEVLAALRDVNPEREPRRSSVRARWRPGTTVEVRASGPHLLVDPPTQRFAWSGERDVLDFAVSVARDAPAGARTLLKLEVFVAGPRVALLPLDLRIAAEAADGARATTTATAARTAFASYSSRDAREVLGRLSSIRVAAGLDVWVDCLSLKPGERWRGRLEQEIVARDLFLLFWSENAEASREVTWELERALECEREQDREKLQLHLLRSLGPEELTRLPEALRERHARDALLLIRDGLELGRR